MLVLDLVVAHLVLGRLGYVLDAHGLELERRKVGRRLKGGR